MTNERKHNSLYSDFLFLRKLSNKEMIELFRKYPNKCILKISMSKKDYITFSWRKNNGKIGSKRIPISIIENAIKNNENPIEAIFEEINKETVLEIAKPENLLGTIHAGGFNSRNLNFSKEERNLSEILCILFTIYYPNLTENGWILQPHDLKKLLERNNYTINGRNYSNLNYDKVDREINNKKQKEEINTDEIQSLITNHPFFNKNKNKTNDEEKLKKPENKSSSGIIYNKEF